MSSSEVRIKLVSTAPDESLSLSYFELETIASLSAGDMDEDSILVRTLYLSCDPYIKGCISALMKDSPYAIKPGETIRGIGVGIVEASTSSEFKAGDVVTGIQVLWQTRFVAKTQGFSKIETDSKIKAIDHLGVLGMASFTAYVGLVTVGKPVAGETLLVSSAAGGVGKMVIQLAKARGMRVVATAGSDEKVEFVKSLGADVAFNYKTCGDYTEALKKHVPEGIDLYFDNVGGEFLEAAIANMKNFGRIVLCGMISQYGLAPEMRYGVKTMFDAVSKRISIFGFNVGDHYARPEYQSFINEVAALYRENKLKYRIAEIKGLESAPQALLDQFDGKLHGKPIVSLAGEAEI